MESLKIKLKKKQLIVFDGDSMTNRRSTGHQDTWPFLRLMNWDKIWPDLMAEMLFCWRPELNLKFFNAASGGSTCRDLLSRLETDVLARKPDWVICSVAGNDVRLKIPLPEYREAMTLYAKKITDLGGQVLFFGLSKQGPDYPKIDTLPARRKRYAVLEKIAGTMPGINYVDLGPQFAAKTKALKKQSKYHTVYADGGHFNAVGHLILAGEMLRVFGVVKIPIN